MTVRKGILVLVAVAGLSCVMVFYRNALDVRREPTGEKTKKSPDLTAALPKTAPQPGHTVKEGGRKALKLDIEEQYADLFKTWGLEGETLAPAVDTLVDWEMTHWDADVLLMDVNATDEEVLAKYEEAGRQADRILSRHFSPQQIQSLTEFKNTIPGRIMLKQAQGQLDGLGIDPKHTAPILNIIVDERRKEQAQLSPVGPRVSVDDPLTLEQIHRMRTLTQGEGKIPLETMVAAKRESHVRILDRVRPYMTPEQYEKFRTRQEAGMKLIETNVQMRRASLAPADNK